MVLYDSSLEYPRQEELKAKQIKQKYILMGYVEVLIEPTEGLQMAKARNI